MEAPTVHELADFTLGSYTHLLEYLREIYTIVPFCGIPKRDVPYLILRHDIDISLHAALKMASLERDLEIRSTYFVLFSDAFYNLLDGDNVKIMREISKMGHEIGLHYQPSRYRSYGRNMAKTLSIERQLLEHFLGKKVLSISRHSFWDRDPFAVTKEYINANDPRFKGDLYIHDSCRAWTPLHGLLELLNDPPRKVQLLIHPQNWQDGRIDRLTLLDRSIKNLEKQASCSRAYFEKVYATDPQVLNYDRLIRKANSEQFYCPRTREMNQERRNSFRDGLGYYDKLFRWYLINTSWGWEVHHTVEKIRDVLRRPFT